MAEHNKLGAAGEEIATKYLEEKGYKILARNYRYQRAEVDIIAQKNLVLVFAEVKTRGTNKHGFPEEFVNARKIELFLLAAEEYIYQNNWPHDIRFDILSVSVSFNGKFQVHHIEDAFH